jgi:hypothetical protein
VFFKGLALAGDHVNQDLKLLGQTAPVQDSLYLVTKVGCLMKLCTAPRSTSRSCVVKALSMSPMDSDTRRSPAAHLIMFSTVCYSLHRCHIEAVLSPIRHRARPFIVKDATAARSGPAVLKQLP